VVQLDQVAIVDAIGLRIFDTDQHVLTALNVLFVAQLSVGHLRVQPVVGVWTDHMQLARLGIAQILGRLHQLWTGWAIGDVVVGKRLAIELDFAGYRVQRVVFRVVVEVPVAYPSPHVFGNLQLYVALFPELLKRHIGFGMGVRVFQHLLQRQPFGELVAHAHQISQSLEDLEVAQAFTYRLDNLTHGVDLVVAVGTAGADVVALERTGRRQHNVGKAGRRTPPRILANIGFNLLVHGANQLVGVLLMREQVVPRRVYQLDVGVDVFGAVTRVRFTRVKQHFVDARRRATRGNGVTPLRQADGHDLGGLGHAAAPIVPAKAHPLARLADFAKHGGEVNHGPVRHL